MYLPTVPRHTAFPRYDPIIGEYFERMTNAYLTLRKRAFLSSTLTGIGGLRSPHDVRRLSSFVHQKWTAMRTCWTFTSDLKSVQDRLTFSTLPETRNLEHSHAPSVHICSVFPAMFSSVIAVAINRPHCIRLSEKRRPSIDTSFIATHFHTNMKTNPSIFILIEQHGSDVIG